MNLTSTVSITLLLWSTVRSTAGTKLKGSRKSTPVLVDGEAQHLRRTAKRDHNTRAVVVDRSLGSSSGSRNDLDDKVVATFERCFDTCGGLPHESSGFVSAFSVASSTSSDNWDRPPCCKGGVSAIKMMYSGALGAILSIPIEIDDGEDSPLVVADSCGSWDSTKKEAKSSTSSGVIRFVDCDACFPEDDYDGIVGCHSATSAWDSITADGGDEICLLSFEDDGATVALGSKMPTNLVLHYQLDDSSSLYAVSLHTSCSVPIFPPFALELGVCDDPYINLSEDNGALDSATMLQFLDGMSAKSKTLFSSAACEGAENEDVLELDNDCCQGGVSFLKMQFGGSLSGILTLNATFADHYKYCEDDDHNNYKKDDDSIEEDDHYYKADSKKRGKLSSSHKKDEDVKVWFVSCDDDCLVNPLEGIPCDHSLESLSVSSEDFVCLGVWNANVDRLAWEEKMPTNLELFLITDPFGTYSVTLHTSCSNPIWAPYAVHFGDACIPQEDTPLLVLKPDEIVETPYLSFVDGVSRKYYQAAKELSSPVVNMLNWTLGECSCAGICPSNPLTEIMSAQPSYDPTSQPSNISSTKPSLGPSTRPSAGDSMSPTLDSGVFNPGPGSPQINDTESPTSRPSVEIFIEFTSAPTVAPPSSMPSTRPSSPPSAGPSRLPTTHPTELPSSDPPSRPACQPTSLPSEASSQNPSLTPTVNASSDPTAGPTVGPTKAPKTGSPTVAPIPRSSSEPPLGSTTEPSHPLTGSPSAMPTAPACSNPTGVPSDAPTQAPVSSPTEAPIDPSSPEPSIGSTPAVPVASIQPSNISSTKPSLGPSTRPSAGDSMSPTLDSGVFNPGPGSPQINDTESPTSRPSVEIFIEFTSAPTVAPPSSMPSTWPSSPPSVGPSRLPTTHPTELPSSDPPSRPACQPTSLPSEASLQNPSLTPTVNASSDPTAGPTVGPTKAPKTGSPTVAPIPRSSSEPSLGSSTEPSHPLTGSPSAMPAAPACSNPTGVTSDAPTQAPVSSPTETPSIQFSTSPSGPPSSSPSGKPSGTPTDLPSRSPTSIPSGLPSLSPSKKVSDAPTDLPSPSPSDKPITTSPSTPYPSAVRTNMPTIFSSMEPTTSPSFVPSTQATEEKQEGPGSPGPPPVTCQSSCKAWVLENCIFVGNDGKLQPDMACDVDTVDFDSIIEEGGEDEGGRRRLIEKRIHVLSGNDDDWFGRMEEEKYYHQEMLHLYSELLALIEPN